jgi:TPR repeat protein
MAAEQRNFEAQFNLGVMYEEGRGVAQDRVRAHMWFNWAKASGATPIWQVCRSISSR